LQVGQCLTDPLFSQLEVVVKLRKTIGLILILLGILVFVSLITADTIHDWYRWSANDTGKAEEFPTFLAYWWNFNKGMTILSFVLGSIPFYIGIRLRR